MAIRNFLVSETTGGEGDVGCMYLDNRGLVTTGRGNLLPDAASANRIGNVSLNWQRIDNGAAASRTDVAAEWTRVGSADTKRQIPNYTVMGGGNFIAEAKRLGIVTLKLTDASLDSLFKEALAQFERIVKSTPGLGDFDKIPGGFPADAQLGILAVVWAKGSLVGPLSEACRARQWGQIASNGLYKIGWSNIRARKDVAIRKCFENAQLVEDQLASNPDADVRIISSPFNIMAA
jgi:hypothetical protein